MTKVTRHTDLEVYKKAFDVAMNIFELSKGFPKDETYSLADQVRRSSRSVCTNLAEAWRKRRYENHFVSKLSNSEMEAGETQSWIQLTVACGYLSKDTASTIYREDDNLTKILVTMINNPTPWLLKGVDRR
jgi:four helix bundle protein